MIGILGGMCTQAGLDFCNKLAILNRGKIDQEYPLFFLYNKSNIPGRPESIGIHTSSLSNRLKNKLSNKKYLKVLKSLVDGCNLLKKSKCNFIVIPCNTAHYWYDDLKKKIKLPISSIGLLATEGTLKTGIYNKFFDKKFKLVYPNEIIQKKYVNQAIKFVKMGNVRAANKKIKPAIEFLISQKCKKIILGCTELPIAIFAFKSFKKIKTSKIFLDPNLILANAAMKKYKKNK